MATDTANLVLKIDSEQAKTAQRELDRLAKSGGKAEKATDGMTGGFNKASFAVTKLSGALSALSIGLALKEIIQTGAEFQKTISNLSAITGATGVELQFMADSAKELGAATTLSASQVATAFKLIASAKPDLLESAEALKAVTQEAITLAEAAMIDVADAASVLGTSLNQFSAGAKEANRFINILAAGAKFGASEITATATALEKVGVVAKSTGLSFEETNAAIQLLAESGTKAEIAGTGLKTILLRLSTQGDSTINPAIVGMAQAFQNLRDQALSATEQKRLFGLEAFAVAQILTNGSDKLETLTEKLTDTTTATEQAAINVDNLAGDWDKLKSATEAAAISLEEKLDPALRAVVQTMTEAVTESSSFFDEMTKIANLSFENPSAVLAKDAENLRVSADDLKDVADTFGKVKFDPKELLFEDKSKQASVDRLAETLEKESQIKQDAIDADFEAFSTAKEKELALADKTAQEMGHLAQRASQQRVGMEMAVAGQIVGLIRQTGEASKGALIGALAIEKGMAAARVIINAEAAKLGAVASVGGNPLLAAPLIASISALEVASLGIIAASGIIGAGQIGQAHGGLTESKSDQTILISKGEAVIQPGQNKDLRAFLEQQKNNGGSRQGDVNINISAIDTQSGAEFVRNNRGAIASAVRRASQARGGR